jgi:hypothetical protein
LHLYQWPSAARATGGATAGQGPRLARNYKYKPESPIWLPASVSIRGRLSLCSLSCGFRFGRRLQLHQATIRKQSGYPAGQCS